MGPKPIPVEKRFWSFVEMIPYSTCWEWSGYVAKHGYGTIYNGAPMYAHRLSWEIHNGKITQDIQVLHKCDNRSCVNPKHLFLGSQCNNMQDCYQKERHPQAKVSYEDAEKIHELYARGYSQTKLGRMFGVSQAAIWYILNRGHRSKKDIYGAG